MRMGPGELVSCLQGDVGSRPNGLSRLRSMLIGHSAIRHDSASAALSSERVLLALAAHNDWEVHDMDVQTAFFYPELKESVYMMPPEGYGEFLSDQRLIPEMVRFLKRLTDLNMLCTDGITTLMNYFVRRAFAARTRIATYICL